MVIGIQVWELHLPGCHSLKDKRQVIRSLKDRLRSKFNVAAAELDHLDSWQRGVIGVVTLAGERGRVEEVLQQVEREAAGLLGPSLVGADVEYF